MTDIYQQHLTAFANVSAHVILHEGRRVATVAFKYPRDGAGRLYAYVHWIGSPMVRGFAAGGGYNKRNAACADAAENLKPLSKDTYEDGTPHHTDAKRNAYFAFRSALMQDDGHDWVVRMLRAGFDVAQAV